MKPFIRKWLIAGLFVAVLAVVGCQTRQITGIHRGMTEEHVRKEIGDPGRVDEGISESESIWYYFAYMAFPHKEWVWVPRGGRGYGGDLVQIQTSSGMRYPKFRIVFTNGLVESASELAPPET